MTRAISMRELQKLSARAIQALPHAVPIKSGTTTVAMLTPVRKPLCKPGLSDAMRKALADIDEAAARRTPEENKAIDELLAERGID